MLSAQTPSNLERALRGPLKVLLWCWALALGLPVAMMLIPDAAPKPTTTVVQRAIVRAIVGLKTCVDVKPQHPDEFERCLETQQQRALDK